MMDSTDRIVIGLTLMLLAIGAYLTTYRIERLEQRVQALERRITALERGHRIENGVETCHREDCPICNR